MSMSKGQDSGMEYAITPETPFTPSVNTQFKPNVYKIGSLLKPTESRHVEYKAGGGNYQRHHLPSDVRRYGSAFLNTSGGTLIIGVADDGIICGIRFPTYQHKQDVRELVRSEFRRFTPAVGDNLYEINFIPCNKNDTYVLEVSIRPGDPSEIYSDGEDKMYYKRDGSVEGPLWPHKIKEIVHSKYLKSLQTRKEKISE